MRPMHLYRGARAKRDLYLDGLVRDWLERKDNFTYTPVLSQPMEDDHWQGRCGYVPPAVIEDFPNLRDYDVYASGPPAMVHAAQVAFMAQGLAAENFYADPFEFQETLPSAVV